VSHRIQIVLPDPATAALRQRAQGEGTPPSTLAGRLLLEALRQDAPAPARQVMRRAQPAPGSSALRPGWLEPYGASEKWRAETWGAIVALHARYPRALDALKDHWWDDQAQLETLCALSAWRAEIDAQAQDPRDELHFQAQLADYARQLRAESRGVAAAWVPGAPPPDWSG
jgi:hypothetical protein